MFTLFRKQHHRGMVFDCRQISDVASDVATDIGLFFSNSAVAQTFAWASRTLASILTKSLALPA